MTIAFVIVCVATAMLARRVVADRGRFRLIAEAEHELRAPLQAIALAAPDHCHPDVERARSAVADLAAARSGRRADADAEPVRLDRLVWRAATASDLAARRVGGGVHLDWSAGPVTIKANRGRLAQALGNLLANAVEHGGGDVRVIGRRTRRGIRVEVRDSGRGHGLTIAAKAVRDSGGTLSAAKAGSGTAVAIDLPVVDVDALGEPDPTDPRGAPDPRITVDPADPAA
jgi:light-regulated signal transduction histidine kinase (bacteriophytochrome)